MPPPPRVEVKNSDLDKVIATGSSVRLAALAQVAFSEVHALPLQQVKKTLALLTEAPLSPGLGWLSGRG